MQATNFMTQKVANQSNFSQGRFVNTTAAQVPTKETYFVKFIVVSAATFSALAGNITGMTGVALPVGLVFEGEFTGFTLTSGSVIAYEGR